MQRIIDFVVKNKEYIGLTALVIISFSIISIGNVNKIGGFRTVVVGSIGWFQELFTWIPNPGALRNENRALRELNLQLSSDVSKMRHSLIENKKLRDLLAFKDKTPNKLITADVVGNSNLEMRNYITIDKGSAEGISQGMCVRTDAGLVGTIVSVSNDFSLVEIILNRMTKISSKLERNRVNGVVSWDGGEYLVMKNIPESFDIQVGDVLLTSEYVNRYPKDIPIGKIEEVVRDRSSLFMKIRIKPFVDFSSLEQVFVIVELPDPERIKIIQDMEMKLQARKK